MKYKKKKHIPKYDTKVFMGHVWMNRETGKKEIRWDHLAYYQHEIDHYRVGDAVAGKLTNKKQLRTDAQNRYMHLYFSLIAMASGHTLREIKNWAKGKCLSNGITEVFGVKVRDIQDTAKLTILEMIEFMARVEEECKVPLPDPSPFQLALTHEEWDELKQAQKNRYQLFRPRLSKFAELSPDPA